MSWRDPVNMKEISALNVVHHSVSGWLKAVQVRGIALKSIMRETSNCNGLNDKQPLNIPSMVIAGEVFQSIRGHAGPKKDVR